MNKSGLIAICISVFVFLVALNSVYDFGIAYKTKDVEYYKVSKDFSTVLEHGTRKYWNSGDFLGRFSIFARKDYLYGFDINQKCKVLGIPFDKPTAHYIKVVNSDEEYYDIYNIDDLPYSTSALYSWDLFESQFSFVTKFCNFIKGIYNDIADFFVTIFRPITDLFSRNG